MTDRITEKQYNLYEFPLLRQITGNTLRPGGLEITAQALELCKLENEARVLDVGCGTGASLKFLQEQGLQVTGVDISKKLLNEAKKHSPVVRASATALPFTANIFKAIFCECVLSILDKPEEMLKECHRILCPDGKFVLSDLEKRFPDSSSETSTCFSNSCLQGAKSRAELSVLLVKSGFKILAEFDFSRKLAELSARMVWEFGSVDAFWELWSKEKSKPDVQIESKPNSCSIEQARQTHIRQYGYVLLIAQKL